MSVPTHPHRHASQKSKATRRKEHERKARNRTAPHVQDAPSIPTCIPNSGRSSAVLHTSTESVALAVSVGMFGTGGACGTCRHAGFVLSSCRIPT